MREGSDHDVAGLVCPEALRGAPGPRTWRRFGRGAPSRATLSRRSTAHYPATRWQPIARSSWPASRCRKRGDLRRAGVLCLCSGNQAPYALLPRDPVTACLAGGDG